MRPAPFFAIKAAASSTLGVRVSDCGRSRRKKFVPYDLGTIPPVVSTPRPPIVANIAVLNFALPFATADRVAVVLLAAAHAGLVAWAWPRLAPLLAPTSSESSVSAAVTDAWSRRWVRVTTGAGVAAFVSVHLLLLIRSR